MNGVNGVLFALNFVHQMNLVSGQWSGLGIVTLHLQVMEGNPARESGRNIDHVVSHILLILRKTDILLKSITNIFT